MFRKHRELMDRIFEGLRGRLDITVCHPDIAGRLIVRGCTINADEHGWENMPKEMRMPRMVYCCVPAWDEAADSVFVFADEVAIVDAPADMVVDAMLDMMYEAGLEDAVDRLENPVETMTWDGDDEEDMGTLEGTPDADL
jgi:hypothetical protein